MVQYFSINSKNEVRILLCLLIFVLGLVSCDNRNDAIRDSADTFSDSIFSHYVLINHVKYLGQVKNLKLEGINKSNLLIYRYCDETCEKCVEEDLHLLLEFQEKYGMESVLVVPSFPDNRNTRIRLNSELRGFNYLNMVEKGDMPLNENTGLAMRFFTFYPKGQDSGYTFFPTKDQPTLTRAFFEFVSEELLKNR